MRRRYSIIIALSISLFIYVFYRSEKTLVNELIIFILSLDTFTYIRSAVGGMIPLHGTIVFSLPGGLWVFCVTALSFGFYMKIINYKVQVMILPIVFAIGLEFCQLLHLTNGRFDIWDIVFYLLFWLLAYNLFEYNRSQQHILSPFTLHGFICVACFLSVYLAHVNQ